MRPIIYAPNGAAVDKSKPANTLPDSQKVLTIKYVVLIAFSHSPTNYEIQLLQNVG